MIDSGWQQAVAEDAEGYDVGDLGLLVDRALHAALCRRLAFAPSGTELSRGACRPCEYSHVSYVRTYLIASQKSDLFCDAGCHVFLQS